MGAVRQKMGQARAGVQVDEDWSVIVKGFYQSKKGGLS
jgi:hypothetical protein